MRLRKERALLALAVAAAVAQFGCSDNKDEATAPVTTATMHSPEADAANKAPEEPTTTSALATLSVASASSVSGDLRLEQRADGVWIEGDVSGLSPGNHVGRIHEKGDCNAPDASSAGDPFVPGESAAPAGVESTVANAATPDTSANAATPDTSAATAGDTSNDAPAANAPPN